MNQSGRGRVCGRGFPHSGGFPGDFGVPPVTLGCPPESLRGLQAMMQVDCEVMDTRVIHVRRRRATPTPRDTPPRP